MRALFVKNKVRFARAEQLWMKHTPQKLEGLGYRRWKVHTAHPNFNRYWL